MPKTTQLTLTLQSKPGVLARVTRALADAGVNITALSAGDRSSSGKLRIVVNNPGRAKRALRAAKLRANEEPAFVDRKSTRLNSSHGYISYAVFCLKKKKKQPESLVRCVRRWPHSARNRRT